MTNTDEIIDIDPESVIEHQAAEKTPVKQKNTKFGLLVAALLASAAAGGWLYRDVLASYLPSNQMTEMATRLRTLEATAKTLNEKVDAAIGFNDEMKSNLAAAQVAASDVAQLKSDSTLVKSKVEKLNAALDNATKSLAELNSKLVAGPITSTPADLARLDNLEKDLASLKQSGGNSTDTVLLSQSLADLKAKIASGVSYQSELERIKNLVPAAEGLDVLQSQASNGIANAENLVAELQNLKFQNSETEQATTDNSWWSYAGSLISSVVTIKSAGTSDWQALASQVSDVAKQGDLQIALATLDKAEGALPLELQTWRDKVASRLAVEQALEKTAAAVLRQIAAKG